MVGLRDRAAWGGLLVHGRFAERRHRGMVARRYCRGMQAPPPRRCVTPRRCPRPSAALVRRARAGTRDDGARIALGIEGGGLAVAMACGMAGELERLGLTPWLDAVYGTSSGSLMAAYVAAGAIDGRRAGARGRVHDGVRELHAARARARRLARPSSWTSCARARRAIGGARAARAARARRAGGTTAT